MEKRTENCIVNRSCKVAFDGGENARCVWSDSQGLKFDGGENARCVWSDGHGTIFDQNFTKIEQEMD